MTVKRSFKDIPDDKIVDADQQDFLLRLGRYKSPDWDELMQSKRILIVSEAGAGKTYECRTQQQALWNAGENAFFLELSTLADSDVRSMLSFDEEERLDAWMKSQSGFATFFLDSYDELVLTRGSFEQALKRLSKAMPGQLGRARIVITTRPIPLDEQLVRRILPVPEVATSAATGDTFAIVAMKGGKKKDDAKTVLDWRTVGLLPFSDNDIIEFASSRGVDDPEMMLADLRRRNAMEYARRPQDLIELCADWVDKKSIRTHREQVLADIRIKLKPRPPEERAEPAELSVDKAVEGASRLALAMIMTRRLTIRYNANADKGNTGVAIDPSVVLADWPPDEVRALLERPLFGFASYGRVRFHHMPVAEYLATERLRALRGRGMSTRALHRLLFARTKGTTIVRPSKRSLAAWLALTEDSVFETLRDNAPDVLLTDGDPESLSLPRKLQALRAYVEQYGAGGWRGLHIPSIQIHRFATPDLAPEIQRLWASGIENREVRIILLNVIEVGQISECADIAYAAVMDRKTEEVERVSALDALIAIDDPRLSEIGKAVAGKPADWPDRMAISAMYRLFPKNFSPAQMCRIITRVKSTRKRKEDYSQDLPAYLANSILSSTETEALRDGLTKLAGKGLKWQSGWPHIVSDRSELRNALARVCVRGLADSSDEGWLYAAALAFHLPNDHRGDQDAIPLLAKAIDSLGAEKYEEWFWLNDKFIRDLHAEIDANERYANVVIHGPVNLTHDRDGTWLRRAVTEIDREPQDRALLLIALSRTFSSETTWKEHLRSIRPLVDSEPELVAIIDEYLRPKAQDKRIRSWELKDARRKHKEARRAAKDHASWVIFWRTVADNPDRAFSSESSSATVWNLWRVMRQAGENSRDEGWNRRFIEASFDKDVADRLRDSLMNVWREDSPTLGSERPEAERDTYLVRWQLGLAAIYAEAEDSQWATRLSDEEALRAARFAPIKLNGFPPWLEDLAVAHPTAIDSTLGKELTRHLSDAGGDNWHSMLLQSVEGAGPETKKVFLPRLVSWLRENYDQIGKEPTSKGSAQKLSNVLDVLLGVDDPATKSEVRTLALKALADPRSEYVNTIWLTALFRLDASAAVDALEKRLSTVKASKHGAAVKLLAALFARDRRGINLHSDRFKGDLLLRLMRLAYQHVRISDDDRHEGSYTPDTRDDAQSARSDIVGALLDLKGQEGWEAKQEMAADPFCAHFKDRIKAVAERQWAVEIDEVIYTDEMVLALDKTYEAAPSNSEGMFSILLDRLSDIQDLLLADISPRDAWAGIKDEHVMRREIARELTRSSNDLYTVDQEAVTAEEKETDIRLRSASAKLEAVIELKLADGRSGKDLIDTITTQLVPKYMAAPNSAAGCLLVTLGKDRQWDHPETGKKIGLPELTGLLEAEAEKAMDAHGGTIHLHVEVLDLRPRLPTEAVSKAVKDSKTNTAE